MTKRAIVLTSRSPYPLVAGFKMRIHYVGEVLATRYRVDLLSLERVEPNARIRCPFSSIYEFPIDTFTSLAKAMFYYAKGLPLQVGAYQKRVVHDWLARNVNMYDLVYVNHVRMAPYVIDLPCFKVLDFHDSLALHYREGLNNANLFWRFIYSLEAPRLDYYEKKVLESFSGAFVTSEVDKEFIIRDANMLKICPLEVIPMGVRPELLTYPTLPEEPWIVFLGNMRYYPNQDAARFFSTEVFPAIRSAWPGVRFWVVGAGPTREILRLSQQEGIQVTGWVKDPWYYVKKAAVVVSPLRLGAGIQNKVLEAMALKKAVVGTSRSFRGIHGGADGVHYRVADTREEMIGTIIELLRSTNQREFLGSAAFQLVKKYYTWDLIGKKLLDFISAWSNQSCVTQSG